MKQIVMCVTVQKEYVTLMSLIAYTAAGLRMNMLQDNIKVEIKEIVLMITRNESNFINTYSQYRYFQSRFW